MKLGKTLKEGGCKYDVISQSNIGPSVVGNSLAAIKKLIFEDKRITWKQLMDALAANWETPEALQIRKLIMRVPKFGNDEDYVDFIVKDVFNSTQTASSIQNIAYWQRTSNFPAYTMSTSNIMSYVPNGFDVLATPDGRYAGYPLNEGCSPTQGTDINGPTAVINSVSKLPNTKVAAGQLLNMRFSSGVLSGEENLNKFVFFFLKGKYKKRYLSQPVQCII